MTEEQKKSEACPLMKYNAGPTQNIERRELTLDDWKNKAETLWKLLDDIDTASDMFKPEKTNFYNYVMRKVEERFLQLTSDGYELFGM